ncbi:hypothetical protein Ahy_A05g025246 [Arachis hypogaea]|uniref:SWIM-type domain-containing protein n=1 Tax=Arachis hypogaea TaxID=3818 RepID=A0A445D7V4_ARAHY|nr:hypothetical protein Ahy_A05g025246 [Arachis hypogaea]
MTTNLVECVNSVLKGARNLSVLKSAEAHDRNRVGFTFSIFAQQRIKANMQCARSIVVHRFDRRNEVFKVCEMPNGKVLAVDLARRTCDCGHFLVERLPCCHVIKRSFQIDPIFE